MLPADLATRDHMSRVRKAGPTNLRSLQGVSAHDPDGWMFLGEGNHSFQAFGKDPIVAEDNLAVPARRRNVTQCSVMVFQGPQELLVLNDPDTRIFLCPSPSDLSGAIRAAVINDGVIPVGVGLSKNAFNAFLKVLRVVIHGSYNGHQGIRRTHSVGQFQVLRISRGQVLGRIIQSSLASSEEFSAVP